MNPPPELLRNVFLIFTLLIASAMIFAVEFNKIDVDRILPQQCTLEAKICPDGSSVGRTGPNCKFKECAKTVVEQIDISDWKTYRNEEYGFNILLPKEMVTGKESTNSVLGTHQKPMKGVIVGPLIFVKLDTQELQQKAHEYISEYMKIVENPSYYLGGEEAEGIECIKEDISSESITFGVVFCGGAGGGSVYALIDGNSQDIFVQDNPGFIPGGYHSFIDKVGFEAGKKMIVSVLSTFKFIK